ncbi:hypothetical protein LVY65_05770 [Sphingomonas sp. G124]|uniref:Uncharacterized protein n=1 Tax=Sphingomonas cremea TaxID=2904799 RepID=A0A9X1QL79_9SPHN|nr:hypothetical protein [Sphingomonas cremea]MCF2514574.1 hypothetical protein [Sphingomonas cremea]
MIVCLGWGSLIWRPKKLPLVDPHPLAWNPDGPKLPIEFLRQSSNGTLTLVIDKGAAPLPVLWAPLRTANLQEAVEALRRRERAPVDRVIGRWPSNSSYEFANVIGEWAQERELKGVVWTDLKAQFDGKRGVGPSRVEAIEYLNGLSRWKRVLAETYVRRAPMTIDTPYRRAIAQKLGWQPVPLTQPVEDA